MKSYGLSKLVVDRLIRQLGPEPAKPATPDSARPRRVARRTVATRPIQELFDASNGNERMFLERATKNSSVMSGEADGLIFWWRAETGRCSP